MLVYPKHNVMDNQEMYYNLHDAYEAALERVHLVSPFIICLGIRYKWVYNVLDKSLYRSGYIQ